jgi:GR25 family glycosyltransferase involved in LPS biosynthesis
VPTLISYVIHYTPLIERKQFLLNEFNKHSLIYHFIEDYDRENLSNKELRLFNTNRVRLPMCSNIMKHIDAYKNIMNNEYKYSLILEDDVILDDKFGDILNKGLEQLPDDYDMLFIGNAGGCNLHIDPSRIKAEQFIYKKCREITKPGNHWEGHGATRCTDSYLVSKKAAKKLINYVSNLKERAIDEASDWWLNRVIRELELDIYWLEPTIVLQGSATGKYKSVSGH